MAYPIRIPRLRRCVAGASKIPQNAETFRNQLCDGRCQPLPRPRHPNSVLLRQDADGVATLTLNRPQARNALSLDLMERLIVELDAIAADASVRVVVIAGAGPAFSAGHDLREVRGTTDEEFYKKLFATCSTADAGGHASAEAGDRARARRGFRRRLPARRELRPRGRVGGRDLRHARREYRSLLLDAHGRGQPQDRPQADDGDAAAGRPHRRDRSAAPGPDQPLRPGRQHWTKRSPASRARSQASRR